MRQPIFRFVLVTALAAVALLGIWTTTPSRTAAGSISTAVIGMFPKSTNEFAYADLKSARKLPWFAQMQDQMLPKQMRDFEQFLSSAGIDPNSQVTDLAWGAIMSADGTSGQILGIALGAFDPSSTEAKFKAQKLPMIESNGYHLYAFGSGGGASDILFFFIDSNTAAFGNRAALEKVIDVRMGTSESLFTNDKLYPLITEANGSGLIWAVLDKSSTGMAMHELLPQASQFPQAAAIVARIHAMIISVTADTGIDVQFQAVCDSVDDANTLGAAMQAGIMYRRYQEAQSNPDFAKALDHVSVKPTGDRLKIDAPVSQDELLSLIRTKALVPSSM